MMERLTYRGTETMTEDGLVKPSYSDYSTRLIIERLAEYEDLEEQGRLIKFPCKVGDVVYFNGILGVVEAEEYKVIRVDHHSNFATKRSEFYIEALLVSDPRNSIEFYDKEIGKTVFLTKSEAKQKLKEMERGKNDD